MRRSVTTKDQTGCVILTPGVGAKLVLALDVV